MRPAVFHVGGTLYWTIRTYDPDKPGVLKDADLTPTVAVRKNGSAVGDSVTITKRSATTGLYDCSYNPAGELEDDTFEFEETATITGSTSASATYSYGWTARVEAVERGTDSANTVTPDNAGITAIKAKTDNLPADPADASDISAAFGTVNSTLATIAGYIDTEVAAIKAKTDNLPVDPADASDIAASFSTVNSTLATIASYIDTEVAAIKAKTDNLPTDPADQSAVEAAITAAVATLPTAAQNADAVWDEAMAGHTTDGTYGGRIVRAANSNVTVQITGSQHIAADVHEFQTDVFDADAIAASAVTEIQSGLATQSSLNTLIQYVDTEVASIKAVTDKVDTMVEVDGLVYRYTTNALEQAPSAGASTDWTANERTAIRTILGIPGSGTTPADPSDGVLYDIKQKTDQIGSAGAITSLLAGAVLEPGTITSFPPELVIGDSYQETDGREIQIPLVDTDGNVLTTVGSRNLADATATFEIRRINESDPTRVITGTATIVDPPGTGTGAGAPYAVVELPADETAKGLVSYRYKGKLILTWSGPGTDVYSFDTETIKFTY